MLRNIIGQIFDAKNGIFCLSVSFFWKMSFSLQKEDFGKKKQKPKTRGNFGQIFNSKKGNFWKDCQLYSMHIYIYIYIYIAVVLLSGPSLAFWGVIIWAKFAFYKTLLVRKHYKNRGFSTFFLKKKLRAQIWGVIIWAKLVIFKMQ